MPKSFGEMIQYLTQMQRALEWQQKVLAKAKADGHEVIDDTIIAIKEELPHA